jgi:hypothetical protein
MKALKAVDFAAAKAKTKKVEIPELGGFLYFKQLSVAEHQEFANRDGKFDLGALLRLALKDEAGNDIFDDKSVNILLEANLTLALRIFNEWQKFNGLDAASIEAVEKN